MTTVRDKKIIVTGGARGIGFNCCRQLLVNGAKAVAIVDLENSDGKTSAESLNAEFGEKRAFFFPADLTKFDEFEDVFKKATEALQGLDIFINNAAILDETNWKKMIDVNYTAVVNNTLLACDYMGKHKGGKGGIIVSIASTAALTRSTVAPIYSGTKHAVLGFTRSIGANYKTTGISVRIICPNVTETTLWQEAKKNLSHFVDKEAAHAKIASKRLIQSPEHVGKSVVEAIEKGENGSVWVTQQSEPTFKVEIPTYGIVTTTS